MFRENSFLLFLSVLPLPLIFFNTYLILCYIFSIVIIFNIFYKRVLFPVLFLFATILFSSFFNFHSIKNVEKHIGRVVEFNGIVLKQKESIFNTTMQVFVPFMKTRSGETLSFMRFYEVEIPVAYKNLKGNILHITGFVSKRKVYKNPFSTNYYYLLSKNKLFYIKVKDRVFFRKIKEIPIVNIGNKLLNHYSNYEVKQFLNALVLGQKESLDFNFRNRVKNLGIYHLFVLSGFHFGIFFLIVLIVLFPIPLRKRYKRLLSLFALSLILVLTSFSAPSTRVYLMLLVYLIFEIDGIDIEPVDAVGMAGIILMVINPFNVFNPGFLMSFFASAGIVVAVKDKGFINSFLIVPFVAFFVMLPFYLYFFNYIPLLSPINNILVIPFIVLLFWLVVIDIFLGGLFAGIVEFYVLKLIYLINTLPCKTVEVFPDFRLIFVAIALFLFFYFTRKVFAFSILSILLIVLSLIVKTSCPHDFLCVFDSKQPQCALIKENNVNIIVNTGDSTFASSILKRELGFRGIKKIDYFIIQDLNSWSLNRLEKICEYARIGSIIVCSKNLTSPLMYRLKWISNFYRTGDIVLKHEGDLYIQDKGMSLVFLKGGLRIKLKNMALCFCKTPSLCDNCDEIVVKRINTKDNLQRFKRIFVSSYCNFSKGNIYSIDKSGGICVKGK